MATTRLSIAKRQYFLAHATGPVAATPAGQTERTYMVQYIQTNEAGLNAAQKAIVQQQPFDELEFRWIRAWITANGGTPPNNGYQSSHWAHAVAMLGKTPSKRMSANMMTFYLNAT